jgi:alpha-keto-acid decarboxylase
MPPPSIGHYLLSRLERAGVRHVFGVPGDYILRFYQQLSESPLQHVGTTREDTAAFAADGYARTQGLGALAVTYGVGALNCVNAIAGAHAESSPVILISGAPSVREQRDDPLLHHRFGPYRFQREIYERITCGTFVLEDPIIAFRQIDRALSAAREHCKPVYIELPRDMVDVPGYPIPDEPTSERVSDPGSLAEAIAETRELLGKSGAPVLIAGVEIHRRGLQESLLNLINRLRLPVAATLSGKSVMGERHPQYLGVYEGALGPDHARERVEQADLILMLGVTLNDIDLGIYTARLDAQRMIRASLGEVEIHHHRYPRVLLKDFMTALNAEAVADIDRPGRESMVSAHTATAATARPITIAYLVARLNECLTPEMQVVCDTGDCLFAAIDLRVHDKGEFLASAFYTTMGFAVPAALGAQVARPSHRALVLVGDGAFQMTGTELSTAAALGLNPVVIVFNNRGYSTERFILDGTFNDISPWHFHRLGEVFGPLMGYQADTESAFDQALNAALATDCASIINVHLSPEDPSPAMRRLAERLGKRI